MLIFGDHGPLSVFSQEGTSFSGGGKVEGSADFHRFMIFVLYTLPLKQCYCCKHTLRRLRPPAVIS